ncbi:serine hydrolase domain-containing protein [Micromonospora carbonacea]|uniref:Beta-lactamase family protein n=1 Tax=Micromonospora carbonacea TaxID=47853 RepID=A0A7H8XR43_9ACTN|nr:serine hydrolase domain-containing protein [Micromonospora carbonacea]MBB5824913.1 CubicO group peptidase (beta-lactamase class C family) [Micromonospora carbonacea]QLD26958.1 beta-lactamase family protein [Micromonospora carbonacea]
MGPDNARGVDRRRLITWGGMAAAGMVAAGGPLLGAGIGHAAPAPTGPAGHDRIPPDTRPGGAYDRYVAQLAAEGRFSGVVLLSHRGRTVLSRSYGMADRERGIRNHEGVAFNLSSGSQPFLSVAVLQLVQQGRVTLSDPVGAHLTGLAREIAEQVTIHHLLTSTSGLDAPMPDWQRVYHSREEVHEHYEQWVRQATLVGVPGAGSNGHLPGGGVGLAMAAQIVEAVSGVTFWDYVHEHVLGRSGMSGSAFYTREQWLTDEHIAHPYMMQADGSLVDAVRNLDKGSVDPYTQGRNPGRSFIGYASGDGFATAPDLVRFAEALRHGTVLDRPHAELFAGAKLPGPAPMAYAGYTMPVSIVNGQWVIGRGGGAPGIGANWSIYPDTGWVGVVLTNEDGAPLLDICLREAEAVTGGPVDPPGGG